VNRPEDSALFVRRSIHVNALPEHVWREFQSYERMNLWWGKVIGETKAGTPQGQRLLTYQPCVGGQVEMEVNWDDAPVRYGGPIVTFDANRELTIENDWMPSRGWKHPTYLTVRLTPVLEGTLVELFHHGFEHVGGDVGAEHAGYEQGWGMLQLNRLKELAEADG